MFFFCSLQYLKITEEYAEFSSSYKNITIMSLFQFKITHTHINLINGNKIVSPLSIKGVF